MVTKVRPRRISLVEVSTIHPEPDDGVHMRVPEDRQFDVYCRETRNQKQNCGSVEDEEMRKDLEHRAFRLEGALQCEARHLSC